MIPDHTRDSKTVSIGLNHSVAPVCAVVYYMLARRRAVQNVYPEVQDHLRRYPHYLNYHRHRDR